ncbi:MAG: hypothetical protein JXQ29_11585 [Planctomycetes bacterium]|nr:hypothetical protein [Planctomycetota bacterium]
MPIGPAWNADHTANAELATVGTVSGSYTDTHTNDAVYQFVQEVESGGNPSSRTSHLEHRWSFQITGGTAVSFHVKAYRTNSSDGDAFVFAYSTNGVDYFDLLTVTKTSDDRQYQSAALPASLRGTVHIRVRDTDRTPGHRSLDTVFIDHLFLRSE